MSLDVQPTLADNPTNAAVVESIGTIEAASWKTNEELAELTEATFMRTIDDGEPEGLIFKSKKHLANALKQ